MRYIVTVEVDVGVHDFTVEVEADHFEEAKEKAKSMVSAAMTFDDFSSHLTIFPWRVEAKP